MSVVCQGLQSSLESQLTETTRTLRLKLEINTKTTISSNSPEMGCWNFLQSLSNPSQTPNQALEKEPSYVHPMMKRSSSKLSPKSLELCTENLGSETGSDMSENTIFSLSSPEILELETPVPEILKLETPVRPPRHHVECFKKVDNNSPSFPPPLTSLNRAGSLRCKPHREGGRLIIKAVESPSTSTYLQAERSNGRLRLCFWKDCNNTNFDSKMGTEQREDCDEDSDMEETENEEEEEEEEEKEEFEEEEEEDELEESDAREDMEENSLEVGGEMGMEKFPRPSWCMEGGCGNKVLCHWEPFWVATS